MVLSVPQRKEYLPDTGAGPKRCTYNSSTDPDVGCEGVGLLLSASSVLVVVILDKRNER